MIKSKKFNFAAIEDEDFDKKYSSELDTVEKRYTFAEKLREALRHSDNYTDSTDDDSYAVDISISGSRTDNNGIRYVCVSFLAPHSFQRQILTFSSTEFEEVAAVVSFSPKTV